MSAPEAYCPQIGHDPIALLDCLPIPALILDGEGWVHFRNHEMRRREGNGLASPGPLKSLFPEHHAVLGAMPWRAPQDVDVVVRGGDGRDITERISLRRLGPGSFLLVFMEQTPGTALPPPDLQTARLASLGFMVAGVCHELSNPLAAVHSMVQMLEAGSDSSPEMLRRGLAAIAANVRRMHDISMRLVGFARPGDVRTTFPIDDAVEEALLLLRQEPDFGQVEVSRRPDPQARVLGDPGQMQQVFHNLMLNAVQAMGGRGTLTVATGRSENGRIRVAIEDTGPGVPAALAARLFEPFFTTKPTGRGTGLGLSISSEIVQEHGGTIRLESAEVGARFIVELPACEEGA